MQCKLWTAGLCLDPFTAFTFRRNCLNSVFFKELLWMKTFSCLGALIFLFSLGNGGNYCFLLSTFLIEVVCFYLFDKHLGMACGFYSTQSIANMCNNHTEPMTKCCVAKPWWLYTYQLTCVLELQNWGFWKLVCTLKKLLRKSWSFCPLLKCVSQQATISLLARVPQDFPVSASFRIPHWK